MLCCAVFLACPGTMPHACKAVMSKNSTPFTPRGPPRPAAMLDDAVVFFSHLSIFPCLLTAPLDASVPPAGLS